MALAVMTFHVPLSLVGLGASVTRPNFSHQTFFSHSLHMLRYPSIIPVVTGCSSFSFLIRWPKPFAGRFSVLSISDLVWSAHCFDYAHYFCLFAIEFQSYLSASFFNNNCCYSSLFSAINTESSAYLKLFSLCPPTLISRYPSW